MMEIVCQSIHEEDFHLYGKQGDEFKDISLNKPADDFVLCRDINGVATAVYGLNNWNFNPYRTSATKISPIKYNRSIEGLSDIHTKELILEVKWLLFCCIYKSGTGRLGRLGAKTIVQYFNSLSLISAFATLLSKNRFTKVELSIKDILSDERNVFALYEYFGKSSSRKKQLNACIGRLAELGKAKIGFSAFKPNISDERIVKQHPLIPPRIYLGFVNDLSDEIDILHKETVQLENFLVKLKVDGYGCTHKSQKGKFIGKKNLLDTMGEAIDRHELKIVLGSLETRGSISKKIRQIQYTLKNAIHLYTGMRDEEVLRLPYNCIHETEVRSKEVDSKGCQIMAPTIIKLLSTTTKFEGYRKDASWFAHSQVVLVIEVLQRIARGIAGKCNFDVNNCSLFIPAGNLTGTTRNEMFVSSIDKSKMETPDWLKKTTITQQDLDLLTASDPEREFDLEEHFSVGSEWPLTSHQFRRSLAFYASNSGFVSLPTLKKQFKHLTNEMSRYYARNYENIKSIFGYYDKKSDSWTVPYHHVLFECQIAVPSAIADQLIDDLVNTDEALFGKSGSFIQKQQQRVAEQEINLQEFRKETERRVRDGELAYRKTILGGCTKVGGCECRMLGEFTGCLTSECAIIKSESVEKQIIELETALKEYSEDTGEYQMLYVELDSLLRFKKFNIERKNLSEDEDGKTK